MIELIGPFITLFVIMDSVGSLPVFWNLTRNIAEKQRKHLANRTFLIAGIVLFTFLFFGWNVLGFFGITISSFTIGGGVVLMVLGIRLVIAHHPLDERIKSYEETIVPIATPLLVGPGVITTTILFVDQHGQSITISAALLALLASWLLFYYSHYLMRILGKQGSDALSRLMGMIIVAIAVQFIHNGLTML